MKTKFISKISVALASIVLYRLVSLLAFTYRFREEGSQHLNAAAAAGNNRAFLLACWHETVLPLIISQKGRAYCSVCSRSNAGTIVAYVMRKLGFFAIQGSRSSGGKEVRSESLAYIDRGVPVAITIDGSHGPRRVAKPGIINLAAKSGAVILPTSVHIDRFWELNTWDKFRLPRPFARVTVVYSEPIKVAGGTEGAEFEQHLAQLTKAINYGELVAEGCSREQKVFYKAGESFQARS